MLVLALALVGVPAPARAHDVPRNLVAHAFVRPVDRHLDLLVRVPTILLTVDLPKRGPGYLDLPRLDRELERAAEIVAGGFGVLEDARRTTPVPVASRISLPSDRSFASFRSALTAIHAPPLPAGTQLFWNQGYLDVHLRAPIRSARSDFTLDLGLPPEVRDHLRLVVRFLPPAGGVRAYEVSGDVDRLFLDPRWTQAAAIFVRSGFLHILGGIDHLLFLLCLVLPFRRIAGLLPVVTSFTVAHSVTLVASAFGYVPSGPWFPPLVEALIALSILFMALENVVAVSLRRRWIVTGLFGLVHGFGFSSGLRESFQFAGDHLLLSLVSFNVGVELGQVLALGIAVPALWLLFRHGGFARWGVVVVSVLVAHQAWHWLVERAGVLAAVEWPSIGVGVVATVAQWIAGLLVVTGAVWLVLGRRAAGRMASRPSPAARPHHGPDGAMDEPAGIEPEEAARR